MSLSQNAMEYYRLGRDIAELTAKRKDIKYTIMSEVEGSILTEDGIRITKFRKSIKDLPLTSFKLILETEGVSALYEICKVVQNRLSPSQKGMLQEIGKGAEEIRVTGV